MSLRLGAFDGSLSQIATEGLLPAIRSWWVWEQGGFGTMATGPAGRVVQLIFAAQRPGGRFYDMTWDLFDKLLAAVIVFCLLCGIVAAVIGHLKNLSVAQSFALGAFLGPYGVVSVVRENGAYQRRPPGCAGKCPRCNAVQNIGETQRITSARSARQ